MLPHIIPAPQVLTALSDEVLVIPPSTLGELAGQLESWAPGAAMRLHAFLESGGAQNATSTTEPLVSAVQSTELSPESFTLSAANSGLSLTAADSSGALYGVTALIQAIRTNEVLEFTATSSPAHSHRGFMLDISRHFFGVADIKATIDHASFYNLNRLHLHLSDDQGWRIEIEGRPKLTEIGGANDADGGPGGFLTLADYHEIQDYAENFGMTLVPEIDLPGHTHAMQVAYPESSPDPEPREHYAGIEVGFSFVHLTSDASWNLLEDIVASLAKHTRGQYLHMGGDEVMKVTRPDYEQFMARLGKLVTKYGKKMVLWQEGAGSDLPEGTQLQYWTEDDEENSLAKLENATGVELVVSIAKHAYLDLKPVEDFPLGLTWAGLLNVERAFSWVPAEAAPGAAHLITGVETCLWTETVRTLDDITTMMLPRLPAVASVAWGSTGSFEEFTEALTSHGRVWQEQGVAFYRDPAVNWN